jgi:hypothetical protein
MDASLARHTRRRSFGSFEPEPEDEMHRTPRKKTGLMVLGAAALALGLAACNPNSASPTPDSMTHETASPDAMMEETASPDAMMEETASPDAMMEETASPDAMTP